MTVIDVILKMAARTGGEIWLGSQAPRDGRYLEFAGRVRGPNSLYRLTAKGQARALELLEWGSDE